MALQHLLLLGASVVDAITIRMTACELTSLHANTFGNGMGSQRLWGSLLGVFTTFNVFSSQNILSEALIAFGDYWAPNSSVTVTWPDAGIALTLQSVSVTFDRNLTDGFFEDISRDTMLLIASGVLTSGLRIDAAASTKHFTVEVQVIIDGLRTSWASRFEGPLNSRRILTSLSLIAMNGTYSNFWCLINNLTSSGSSLTSALLVMSNMTVSNSVVALQNVEVRLNNIRVGNELSWSLIDSKRCTPHKHDVVVFFQHGRQHSRKYV